MMAILAKLMMAPAKTLHDLLKQFGESPKAKERLVLIMETDQLSMAEMGGESWKASLLAFRSELSSNQSGGYGQSAKTEKGDRSPGNSNTVHSFIKISGQFDSKTGISYTSLIRQIELGLQKGHSVLS